MKKSTICLFVLLTYQFGFSQLFVKTGSSVYVKNTVLFAKGAVELDGTSTLYLRNEAQLAQGTIGTSTNRGTGKISVFQEGTSDNYEYNYWSSPVGNSSNNPGNENFDIGMIYRPTTNINSTQALTTGSYNGISVPLTIAKYWIYAFRAGSTYSNWFSIMDMPYTNANALKPGEGFSMKGTAGADPLTVGEATVNNPHQPAVGVNPEGNPSNQRYDFRGKPNDGDISIGVLPPVGGIVNNTLTGNPYPSAINLNYFLLENSGYPITDYVNGTVGVYNASNRIIDGTAYFWEQNKTTNSHNITSYDGGYSYYVANNGANSPGTFTKAVYRHYNGDGSDGAISGLVGVDYRRMFLPVGQGFMISGDAAASVGNPAKMKNVYRVFKKESDANGPEFARNSTVSSPLTTEQNWEEIPNVAGVDYTQFSQLPLPQIKIHTIFNNEYTKEITMAFKPNSTDGFDPAMEAQSIGGFASDINFVFANNDKSFAITTLPFAMEKRIPVTLKSAGVLFKVKVDSFINFDETNTVYLFDNTTGIYHDIANVAYEFSLPEGTYSNRFEITFQNAALANPNNVKENFIVVQNNANQLLSISNPNSLDVKSVLLYDISGKQIFIKANLGAKTVYEFPTNSLSAGVYLVKLQTTDNQSLTQKIIVGKN